MELWLEQSMFSFTKCFLSNIFRLVQFKKLYACWDILRLDNAWGKTTLLSSAQLRRKH